MEDINERIGRAEYERTKLIEMYGLLFNTTEGQIILKDLEDMTCANELTSYRSGENLTDMVFREGAKYVVKYIQAMLKEYKEVK